LTPKRKLSGNIEIIDLTKMVKPKQTRAIITRKETAKPIAKYKIMKIFERKRSKTQINSGGIIKIAQKKKNQIKDRNINPKLK
jgi:hypothetical protein